MAMRIISVTLLAAGASLVRRLPSVRAWHSGCHFRGESESRHRSLYRAPSCRYFDMAGGAIPLDRHADHQPATCAGSDVRAVLDVCGRPVVLSRDVISLI